MDLYDLNEDKTFINDINFLQQVLVEFFSDMGVIFFNQMGVEILNLNLYFVPNKSITAYS